MFFALELSDDVDPTALATIALAVLTLAAVIVGGKALREAQNEIDLSRQEVEEAHRPVVIPVYDEGRQFRAFADNYPAKPAYRENNRLLLPIKNIGSGPALNTIAWVTPLNDAGERSEFWGDQNFTATVLGLGVMELAAVVIGIPSMSALPSFHVRLTYADVAGKKWTTSADYLNRDDGLYVDMSVDAGDRP